MEIVNVDEIKRVVKEMYGKRLTEAEFTAFMLIAQRLGLDPVSREIIPQVREGAGGRQVSFIISRDGYLKAAMRDPDYGGLQSMTVREGDHFEVIPSEGRVVHRFGAKRGAILGAWAIAYHRKRPPVVVFVDFGEYAEANKNSPTWRAYPSAMIQKVAEVAALRRQFNLSGAVAAEEIGMADVAPAVEAQPMTEKALPQTTEASSTPAQRIDVETGEILEEAMPSSQAQHRAIINVLHRKGFEERTRAMALIGHLAGRPVKGLEELSFEEAAGVIQILQSESPERLEEMLREGGWYKL